ncbi:MAG: RNA polymerase sigma factor [Parabacteroides sp.]
MDRNREDIARWVCELALADSQTALKALYMTFFERLRRFVGLYIASPETVEEIVSDTFLTIWENRKQLPEVGHLDAYLYAVARNKAVSYLRVQQPEMISLDEIPVDLFSNTTTSPEEDLISQEEIERLNRAIEQLPPKCKMAFKLVREDRFKYKEAASILHISVKTLEAHVALAVKRLYEALKRDR